MKSSAVIVGIDKYATQPLTSAVNDALEFKHRLIDSQLVANDQITTLTSPQGSNDGEATADNIISALYAIYDSGDEIDRFFFFFSGHGIMARQSIGNTFTTALLASDCEVLDRHGSRMIAVSELLDKFELIGPKEQFFFIDACRDMPYDSRPDVASLGWGEKNKPGSARSQTTIFAVSPLGRAEGAVGGLGVMTTHLLTGLQGSGKALEYDPAIDKYVVTGMSLSKHVEHCVHERLKNEPEWKLNYQLPQPQQRGPEPQPLITMDRVPDVPLTVHVTPDSASATTSVQIFANRQQLPGNHYPPRQNHETIYLTPQYYSLNATSTLGTVEPEERTVDIRVENEAIFRVNRPIPGFTPPKRSDRVLPVLDSGLGSPSLSSSTRRVVEASNLSSAEIKATAIEPQTSITLEAIEPPYEKWQGYGRLEKKVPPGFYRVIFRLGETEFNRKEFAVQMNEVVKVSARAEVSPFVAEVSGLKENLPETMMFSESIGPMQAALLPTMLPIIGIKPFEVNNDLFHQFNDLIEARDPIEFGNQPLSIVLCIDGTTWKKSPVDLLDDYRVEVIDGIDQSYNRVVNMAALKNVPQGEAYGFQRIRLGIDRTPEYGAVRISRKEDSRSRAIVIGGLPKRATVVTITLRPDGTHEISQNILRLPGQSYDSELLPSVSYGKLLRQLQIGQALYRSGELIQIGVLGESNDADTSFLQELLFAKWSDPILGCMGYFAWKRATQQGLANMPDLDSTEDILNRTAKNLLNHFGGLVDSRVIYGLQNPQEQAIIFDQLLRDDRLPILAESARALADFAQANHHASTQVESLTRQLTERAAWSVLLETSFTGFKTPVGAFA